jgi:predicted glycosyltransferase
LLPRSDRQAKELRETWAEPIANKKVVIPQRVLDGLNVIWFSDLVISGGGTMNREAAALGIPVYSVFRGRIGAVDRYLADNGRLVLLESVADVQSKIAVERRPSLEGELGKRRAALPAIVEGILSIAEHGRLPALASAETVSIRS